MTWQRLGPGQVAQLKAFQSGGPLPFRVKMRGYHRVQVETYFRELAAMVGTASPSGIERPAFDIVMRGYDPVQVDVFLAPLFEPPAD